MNAADDHTLIGLRELAPHFSGGETGLFPRVELDDPAPEDVARACAEAWRESGQRPDLREQVAVRPRVWLPREVDHELLRHAVFHLGHLAGRDDLKERLRSAFAERVTASRGD